jgi:hypothetical protein
MATKATTAFGHEEHDGHEAVKPLAIVVTFVADLRDLRG